MRRLFVGVAARLGWRPCACHDAVVAVLEAQSDAENEIRALRAELTRLKAVPAPRQGAAA